jgi:hypothetical protein
MPITYSRCRSFILRLQMMGMGSAPRTTSVKMWQAVSSCQPHSMNSGRQADPNLQMFQYTRLTKRVKSLHRGSHGFIH